MASPARLRRNGTTDLSAGIIAMVGIAVPTFVIGPLLQIVFGLQLHWLPIAGWDGSLSAKVLPILVLALPNIAYISRLTRGSMIETLRTNYVRTARAKGIGATARDLEARLDRRDAAGHRLSRAGDRHHRHRLGGDRDRSSASPASAAISSRAPANRDYPLVMGVTILYGGIVILANILTDVAARPARPEGEL